jgi:succinate-semialdehyde dehydrogenase / glutarate-semialdehyde dehydrogenase
VLRKGAPTYARLMAEEMGKPIRDGLAEVQKCAGGCECYAENAEQFLAPEGPTTAALQTGSRGQTRIRRAGHVVLA